MNECDWDPHILTRKVPINERRYDTNLFKYLPQNIKIKQFKAIDLIILPQYIRRVANFFSFDDRFFSDFPKSMFLTISNHLVYKPLIKLSNIFIKFMKVLPPDSHIYCIPVLYFLACNIIYKEKIDVVLTGGNPSSLHLAGYLIKKKTNLPWVVSYADEWSQHPWRKPLLNWQGNLDRWLEKKILLSADRVIATTPSYRKLYSKLLSKEKVYKFVTINHTYDRDDFIYREKIYSESIMKFVYIGSLYGDQSPVFFLTALKQLIESKLVPINKIKLIIDGYVTYELQNLLNNNSLKPIIQYSIGSHTDAIKNIQNADVLILIVSSTRGAGNIPGKTIEYIASGRPILALVPPVGDAADIINKTRTGIVVDPEDIESIKNRILELYNKWEKNKLNIEPNWEEINKYEAGVQARKLAGVFEEILLNSVHKNVFYNLSFHK